MKSLLKFTFGLVAMAGVLVVMAVVMTNIKNNQMMVDGPVRVELPTSTLALRTTIKFGVMADVHLDWDEWEKLLAISKEKDEEFVIIAGDLTSLGKRNELVEAKKVIDRSGVKYFVVPGNHDLWEAERLKRPLFNEMFGDDYQSVRLGQTKFILLNNGSWKGLGDTQRNWLESEVGECHKIKCIAVMHMPLNHSFSDHIMGEDSEDVTAEARELIELFNANNIKDILAGHLHYSGSYELDNIRTTVVGAVNRPRNTQTPRYTHFEFDGVELNREVVVADEYGVGN